MKLNLIKRIAKKEFLGYINSALAYTVIVPFLLLSIFIYTRTALVGGEASLRPYFELLPWFLLLLAPALSMKLLTDEHRSETLELLFAHPISELEIVLGKFFGALSFYVIILLTTMGLPLTYQTMYGIDALPPAIGDSDFLNSWRKILEQEALMAKISADVTKLTKTADGKGLLSPEMASATVLTSYGLMKRNAFLLEGSAEQALTALIAAWAGLNKSE